MTDFIYFSLIGNDAEKFLQGQLTVDVKKVGDDFIPTAICNLKGRVQFGLWIHKIDDGFGLVLAADLADDFAAHIKKFGAFSKITLSAPSAIYPAVLDDAPSFSQTDAKQMDEWQALSIATGNYWITQATSEAFQPQELRLHQSGGVDYNKGCYLGQEIVARLYFKAAPKAYLHRVLMTGDAALSDKIQIVNQISTDGGTEALVIARPDDLAVEGISVLDLPDALMADIGR